MSGNYPNQPNQKSEVEEILDSISSPDRWIQRCLDDLYFLCRTILVTLEDPKPGYKDLYFPTHKRICDFVQNYAKDGQKLLLLTPRGWIKSYLVTVGWSLQRLLRNLSNGVREHQMISNATIGNAKNFLEKIKYNVKYNDLLRGLFREYLPKNCDNDAEKWTQDEIQISGNLIETGSVEGNLVSRHYKVMINDDLVNKDNSATKEQLVKTLDWWKLAQSLLLGDGIEINIGTRWAYEDLYGNFIDQFIKPKELKGEDFDYLNSGEPIVELHNGNYHMLWMDCWADPKNETGSTFPNLFPEEKLKELQEQQKERFFGQYRNNPLAKGRNPFSSEWFSRWKPEELPQARHTIMLIDPSGKAQVDSDYTGIVVMHLTTDRRGLICYGRRHLITDRALAEWIIFNAPRWKPDLIYIEDSKYRTIYELLEILLPQLHRMHKIEERDWEYCKTLPYILNELQPHGRKKEVRIRNLTGWIENGQFCLPFSGAEDLEQELIRYPSLRDDVVDALAYALDVLLFPHTDAPPKSFLSDEEKKTALEREEDEWNSLRDVAYAGEQRYLTDSDAY